MTKHFFPAPFDDEPRTVEVGYDRPCDHFFINVSAPERPEEEQLLYSSCYDVRWYKHDRGMLYGGVSATELQQVFGELLITPPAGLLDALQQDAALKRGNDIRHWDAA